MAEGLDREWLFEALGKNGQSLRKLATYMGLDVGAVSRMVNGKRHIRASEQDQIASFLGVSSAEVAAHRGTARLREEDRGKPYESDLPGLGEVKQAQFTSDSDAGARQSGEKEPVHHPAYGALKGMVTLLPDVDYSEPADPEWGKTYEE